VAQKPAAAQQTWVLPVLGMCAMFSMVAVGGTVYRNRRAGREVRLSENAAAEEEALVEAQ